MELILIKDKDVISINHCKEGTVSDLKLFKNTKANWTEAELLERTNETLLSVWDISKIKDSSFGITETDDMPVVFFIDQSFENIIAIDNMLKIVECTVQKSKDGNTYVFTNIDKAFESYRKDLRDRKLEKLIEVLGKEWFKGKKVFELGCGHAQVSARLHELGAKVSCSDAREEHIEYVNKKYPFITTYVIDQNEPWKLDQEYDLVISWGVNEHLEHWAQDLKSTMQAGKKVSLDMVISEKDTFICEESGYENSIHRMGSRVTIKDINKILAKSKKEFIRYDEAELNFVFVEYDWKENTSKDFNLGHRRFWISE